jgi:hypothetical protein
MTFPLRHQLNLKPLMIMSSPTSRVIGAFLAACFGLSPVSNAASVHLFEDTFADGNYTANPVWLVSAGDWSVVDGAVQNAGLIENDYLTTRDFTPIANGVFTVSIDVKFSSEDVTGNNRLYIRMRDSGGGNSGYEIAIAQGTMNNSTVNVLGGATVSGVIRTSTAHTFPLDEYVNITWSRDSSGSMLVTVNGREYMSIAGSSISTFDTLQIGGRGLVKNTTASYTFSFDNIRLSASTGPEPRPAAAVPGGAGALVAGTYRLR